MGFQNLIENFIMTVLCSCILIQSSSRAQPSFESMQTRVVAMSGSTVHLACPISNLTSQYQVLWRKVDVPGMLAMGTQVLAGDSRFAVEMNSEAATSTTTYQLTVGPISARDLGSYYCQIFDNGRAISSPKIKLVVGVCPAQQLSARLSGSRNVRLNNQISLNCVMPTGVVGPLMWFKDDQRVMDDTENYDTVIYQWRTRNSDRAGSTLSIRRARLPDGGPYICLGFLGGRAISGQFVVRIRAAAVDNRIPTIGS